MTHEERIALISDVQFLHQHSIYGIVDEKLVYLDVLAKFLVLFEDLISKLEALTDRTPDFRTKDHQESPSEMAARVQFKTIMEDREGRRKVVDSGKEIDHGEQ